MLHLSGRKLVRYPLLVFCLLPALGLGLAAPPPLAATPAAPAPAAPTPADALAANREADVWAAVLRFAYRPGTYGYGNPIFLSLDRDMGHGREERDPSDAHIRRLRQRGVPVRKKSETKFIRRRMGMFLGYFVNPKTGARADTVGLTSVHWISPTCAEVDVDWIAGGQRWTMALTPKGWVKVRQVRTYIV